MTVRLYEKNWRENTLVHKWILRLPTTTPLQENGRNRMTTKPEKQHIGLDWLGEAKRMRNENDLLRKKLAEAKCSLELIMKMTTELLNETEKKS
jgi:hypothetical protein